MAFGQNYMSGAKRRAQTLDSPRYVSSDVSDNLMKNAYVHSNIENFRMVAARGGQRVGADEVIKTLRERFNTLRSDLIQQENAALAVMGLSDPAQIVDAISFGGLAKEIQSELSLYNLFGELLDEVDISKGKNDGKMTGPQINKTLQSMVNEKLDKMQTGEYTELVGEFRKGMKMPAFEAYKKGKKYILKNVADKPGLYFKNMGQWQGMVQEFSTLAYTLGMDQVDEVMTEVIPNSIKSNNKNVTVVRPGGKADTSIKSKSYDIEVGFSEKFYRTSPNDVYRYTLHSGAEMENFLDRDLQKVLQESGIIDLEDLLESPGVEANIRDYFAYTFVNLYAFSTSGGYEGKTANRITTIDSFGQFPFIQEFLNYTTQFWIGTQLLDLYSASNQNQAPVLFMVLQGKVVRVSSILDAIMDEVEKAEVKFATQGKLFGAQTLRKDKRELLHYLMSSGAVQYRYLLYPQTLVAMGSTVGQHILQSTKFKVKLNINLAQFK